MSEESSNEVTEIVEAPAQEQVQQEVSQKEEMSAEKIEDLKKMAASSFDLSEEPSTGENPEKDDDWKIDLEDKEEENEEKDDESELKADSEQSNDSSEPAEEEKTPSEDSSGKEEQSLESSDDKLYFKVDGEDRELTLSEIKENHPDLLESLKSGVSGAVYSARRISELDKREKAFEAKQSEIEGYIDQFAESTKDGNILGGLTYFAEFANIPPYLLKEQLIASLRPEIEKRNGMTEDQINNMRLHEENQWLTKKNESDQQKWQEEQAQAESERKAQDLQNQINSIRETHKINDEEWDAAYKALDESLPPEMAQIPLKAIEEHILSQRAEVEVNQRLDSFIQPVSDKVNEKFVSELRHLMVTHPHLSDADLQQVVNQSLKLHEEKELKKTLEKKSLEKPKKLVKNDSSRSFKDLQSLVDWD